MAESGDNARYIASVDRWTPEQHAQVVRGFFKKGVGIDNEPAVANLIKAGYDRFACLEEAPPTGDDLDKLGFNMYQRNRVLVALANPSRWLGLDDADDTGSKTQ